MSGCLILEARERKKNRSRLCNINVTERPAKSLVSVLDKKLPSSIFRVNTDINTNIEYESFKTLMSYLQTKPNKI